MKKFTQKIRLVIILLVTTLSTQSCIYGADGVGPKKNKYVVFTQRPDHHTLTSDGAYQDIAPADGYADLRDPSKSREYAQSKEGTDGYVVSKTLYYMDVCLWDGNENHKYELTNESVWVAFGPASKAVVGKPIKVVTQGTVYSLDKDEYDRINLNIESGRATKFVAVGF